MPESEDEILDESQKPASPKPTNNSSTAAATANAIEIVDLIDNTTDIDAPRYSEKADYDRPSDMNEILSSGSDTEDELDRVLERQKKAARDGYTTAANAKPEKPKAIAADEDDDDAYSKTTDEEQRPVAVAARSATETRNVSISPLPEFYRGKRFYLSSNLDSVEMIKLRRFVEVYGGQITRNAAEAEYIVSNKAKQLSPDFGGEVVRPLWVLECNDMECLLPTKRYKFDC